MTASASILGYRRFLEARDGAPDLYRDTLSRREEFFQRIETEVVRSKLRYDRDTFLRNVVRKRPEPGLDERMLWILATAKANQNERFGVELGRLYGRGPREDDVPEHLHVILQESSHTRILADVVALFGLPVPHHPPPFGLRAFIKLMVFNPFPERFMLPVVGMSEMLGCVLFKLLRDRGVELFADEPEVAARLRLLYDEILADEICHVGLVNARLGRFGRGVTRLLYRLAVSAVPRMMGPEVDAILGKERIARAARDFDVLEMAAEFPETAYAF